MRLGRIAASKDDTGRWYITQSVLELYRAGGNDRRQKITPRRAEAEAGEQGRPKGKPLIIHVPETQLKEVSDFLMARGIIPQVKHSYIASLAKTWQDKYEESVQEGMPFDWRATADALRLPKEPRPADAMDTPEPEDTGLTWQQAWFSQKRPTFDLKTGQWITPGDVQ